MPASVFCISAWGPSKYIKISIYAPYSIYVASRKIKQRDFLCTTSYTISMDGGTGSRHWLRGTKVKDINRNKKWKECSFLPWHSVTCDSILLPSTMGLRAWQGGLKISENRTRNKAEEHCSQNTCQLGYLSHPSRWWKPSWFLSHPQVIQHPEYF